MKKKLKKLWNVQCSLLRVQSGEKSIHAVGWKLFSFNHWRNDFHHHCVAVTVAVTVGKENIQNRNVCRFLCCFVGATILREANSIVCEISIFFFICSYSFCVLGSFFPLFDHSLFAFLHSFFPDLTPLCAIFMIWLVFFPFFVPFFRLRTTKNRKYQIPFHEFNFLFDKFEF